MPFAGNMPKIDLMARNRAQDRTIHVQVKTKRGGRSWHASILGSGPMKERPNETDFWIFVDLGDVKTSPRYWVVPDWWMRNDIHQAHRAYVDRHGGKRARNPDSTHHSIEERRLVQWEAKWDLLGIFQ